MVDGIYPSLTQQPNTKLYGFYASKEDSFRISTGHALFMQMFLSVGHKTAILRRQILSSHNNWLAHNLLVKYWKVLKIVFIILKTMMTIIKIIMRQFFNVKDNVVQGRTGKHGNDV